MNIFGTLFWCLHCWLWTIEYWMGPLRKFPKTRIPEKSGKVTCWAIQKAFTNTQFFLKRPLDFTRTKQLVTQTNHNNNLIFLVVDIALWYSSNKFCKFAQINPFHLTLIHAYRWRHVSLKYINILFSLWTPIPHLFFLDTLAVTKIYTKFLKVKIPFSHIIIWQKDFIIH